LDGELLKCQSERSGGNILNNPTHKGGKQRGEGGDDPNTGPGKDMGFVKKKKEGKTDENWRQFERGKKGREVGGQRREKSGTVQVEKTHKKYWKGEKTGAERGHLNEDRVIGEKRRKCRAGSFNFDQTTKGGTRLTSWSKK